MGYDLYRDEETDENLNYFRWNIWGFPPVRYLGEIYGWIPQGTVIEAWTDDDGKEYESSEAWYDTNDGQIICAEDAQLWADALKLAIEDIKKQPIVKESTKSTKIDDAYMAEREEIHNKVPETILRQFNTETSIGYLERYVTFLEGGDFKIY
tara:strand:- start:374 stop:829 length:456 start_codon:yes stop_codon:yes gene_type:complete